MFNCDIVTTVIDQLTGDICLEYKGKRFLSLVKNSKDIMIRKAGLTGTELLGLLEYIRWFLHEILELENCGYINVHKEDFDLLDNAPNTQQATFFLVNDQYCFLKNSTYSIYKFNKIFNFKNVN